MLLRLVLTGLCLIFTKYFYQLAKNYLAACRLCLPIVVCPFTWQNGSWACICTVLQIRRFSHLPGLGWTRYSYLGWSLHETYHSRHRFGPAFIIVSSNGNEIVLHDPKAIAEVFSKYKKWERPREAYEIFSLLGENVDSVRGENWPRHRKVMNAGFTEGCMRIVWDFAVKQAQQWAKGTTMTFQQLNDATDAMSANVLVQAVFEKDYDYRERGSQDLLEDQKKSFIEAIQLISQNLPLAWTLSRKRLPILIKSEKITELCDCLQDLKAYLKDWVRCPNSEFIEAMVNANTGATERGREHLSEDEFCGNLFILQLAGSDTTSYAISYTLAMLSANPDTQDWIRDEFIPGSYEKAYPRTLRCRAAVMETLRLHTPAPSFPRHSLRPEVLHIAGEDYVVPPNMVITSSIPSVHNDPAIWGEDVNMWKPQRWVEVLNGEEMLKERLEMMAWSTGPRVCPGKKFSQVEIVAVLCTVLRDYRLVGTDNMEQMLHDFDYSLTPKPRNPATASIRFVKLADTK